MIVTKRPNLGLLLVAALLLVGCAGTSGQGNTDDPSGGSATTSPGTTGGEGEAENAVPTRPQDAGFGEISTAMEYESALKSAVEDIEEGDYDDARDELEDLTDVEGAAAFAYYNLGIIEERTKNTPAAIEQYRKALSANPDFSPALVNICRIHLRSGNSGKALQVAEQAIATRPENNNHVDAKMQVLLVLRRFEDVITEAKAVLRRDERNVRAKLNMAAAYYGLGKYELAEDILGKTAQGTADKSVLADVHYRQGFVYLALEDKVKARLSFEKAVDLRPDHAEARNNLGVLYHEARDYSSAVAQYERALSVWPDFTEALINLGNAYKGQGSYPKAETTFKRAASIDANYAPAYFNLGVLYLDTESIGGRDKKEQFQLAIDNFLRYKSEMKSALPRDDPADKYIAEAKKKIELEKKREQQRREALKAAEEEPPPEDFDDDGGEDK